MDEAALIAAVGCPVESEDAERVLAAVRDQDDCEEVDFDGAELRVMSRALGLSVTVRDGGVRAVQLYGLPKRGRAPWAGAWPLAVDPALPASDVRAALPAPLAEGGGRQRWYRYALDDTRYLSLVVDRDDRVVRAVIGLRERWE